MIWAACCLAFFAFLLVSEFTTPADDQYDKSCHLSFNSVSVNNRTNPQQLRISIKQSKTDPFCKGVNIFLGATSNDVRPIKDILPYLAVRGNQKGPLFILKDGRNLTHQFFSSALSSLLKQLHINTDYYNTQFPDRCCNHCKASKCTRHTDKDDGQMWEWYLPVLHQNTSTRSG